MRSLWAVAGSFLVLSALGACDDPMEVELGAEECLGADGETLWGRSETVEVSEAVRVRFRDCRIPGDDWIEISEKGPAANPVLHLFEYNRSEISGWRMVDGRSGQVIELADAPVFSADGGRFAVANANLMDSFRDQGLRIYRVDSDGTFVEYASESDGAWGARSLTWVDSVTLTFEQLAWRDDAAPGALFSSQSLVAELEDGVWRLRPREDS